MIRSTLHILFITLLPFFLIAQKQTDSLAGFDMVHFNEHLSELKDAKAKSEYLNKVQRAFIKRKFDLDQSNISCFKPDSTAGCGNLDFENGNTNGWAINGDFQLMAGSSLDPFGGFPVVCPGGNYSLKLNDNNTTSTKTTFASSAIRTIAITSANSLIKINYAGAFLNYPHPAAAAPIIKIEFLDASNNVIPTQSISVYYAVPPGAVFAPPTCTFLASSTSGQNIGNQTFQVTSVPWQAESFNLSSYVGQNIKIKLSANWCLYNYDWAYAYFDICCSSLCPNPPFFYSNNPKVCTTYPYILCGPAGMLSYLWSNSTGTYSAKMCDTISSPGVYSLTCYSNPTLAINSTYTVLTAPSISFTMAPYYCYNASSSASGINLVASPSGGVFSGPGVTGTTFVPSNPGINTITYTYAVSGASCTAISSQTTNVVFCLDVSEISILNEISVYPNPFSTEIIVKASLQGTIFTLFNALGQEVAKRKLEIGNNIIPSISLSPGIYIYSISNENQLIKKGKLIKE